MQEPTREWGSLRTPGTRARGSTGFQVSRPLLGEGGRACAGWALSFSHLCSLVPLFPEPREVGPLLLPGDRGGNRGNRRRQLIAQGCAVSKGHRWNLKTKQTKVSDPLSAERRFRPARRSHASRRLALAPTPAPLPHFAFPTVFHLLCLSGGCSERPQLRTVEPGTSSASV